MQPAVEFEKTFIVCEDGRFTNRPFSQRITVRLSPPENKRFMDFVNKNSALFYFAKALTIFPKRGIIHSLHKLILIHDIGMLFLL